MKKLIIILPLLILSFYSCGLLDTEDGMNPPDYAYVYRIYSMDIKSNNLKLLSEGTQYSFSQEIDALIYLYNGGIYFMDIEGINKHLITPSSFYTYNFWLSYSGEKIYIGEYYDPHLINIDGSNLMKLNLPDSIKYLGGWAVSSNMYKAAFSFSNGLYLMNFDGTNIKQLQDSSNSRTYSDISFTPNDSSIVYIQDEHNSGKLSLKLFNIKNYVDTTLFPENGGNHIISYLISQWNTVLFVSTAGIHLLDLNTLKYTFLTKGSYPHYSNDGNEISYIILDNPGIYIYNLQSKDIMHIDLTLPNNYIKDPIFLSDKNKIIFEADSSYIVSNKK